VRDGGEEERRKTKTGHDETDRDGPLIHVKHVEVEYEDW
jgi:hypothetical protein